MNAMLSVGRATFNQELVGFTPPITSRHSLWFTLKTVDPRFLAGEYTAPSRAGYDDMAANKRNGKGKRQARALGINHVVLEVGDLDEALAFYGGLFAFTLRGRSPQNAFIDMGDQFIQLRKGRTQEPDGARHFGFVVDDRGPVWEAVKELGIELIGGRLNFRDPWGNRIEVVAYDDIQFTKAPHVLRGMGTGDLEKTPDAIAELAKKGMVPDG